jgi:sugar phosphate isomerase/epimerase
MNFSYLTNAAPGNDLYAQCDIISKAGCQGIETLLLPGTDLGLWQTTLRKGASDHGLEIPVVIIGGLALFKQGQMGWVREALHAVSEIGAGVLITPEYQSQDPLPLLPPFPPPPPDEQALVDQSVQEIGEIAAKNQINVFCEPITPFQSRFWRDTDTVLNLCQRLNNPYVGLVLDFWVMNLTDVSISESIRKAGTWTHHIHLADNNRLLPGQGHIDFASGFHVLKELGYSGWFSFECAAAGNFTQKVGVSIKMLKSLWV